MYRLNHLNPPPNHPFQRLYDPYGHAKITSYPSLPDLRRDNNRSDDISMLNSPSSLTIANGLSSNALQAHLYTAFLERKTADVALHVRGTWHAIYRLHRVVLIQAVSMLSPQHCAPIDITPTDCSSPRNSFTPSLRLDSPSPR